MRELLSHRAGNYTYNLMAARFSIPAFRPALILRTVHEHRVGRRCTVGRASPDQIGADGHVDFERLNPENLLALLQSKRSGSLKTSPGEVHLVGTGPGDPGLLTLHALRLMQTADVVLYDRLVSPDILRLVHGAARMIYVGKEAGYHTRTQSQIHELLCECAEAGHVVLRLKGGDPFVFGRGGEEALHLQEHGIAVHAVPGITAASGICADIGVPLTHRGIASSVRFLTGHAREGGKEALDETTDAAVDKGTTLVVYMGLATLPELTRRLMAAGLAPDTPAVAVERGTLPEQRSVFAPLEELQQQVAAHSLQSPTLIVIGYVVALAAGWKASQGAGAKQTVPLRGRYLRVQEAMRVTSDMSDEQHLVASVL